MILHFDIIPHKHQRYDTVGDWRKGYREGIWHFLISKMRPQRYSWLVFFHEVIEWGICQLTGVKQRDVDRFDIAYEKASKDRERLAPCGCEYKDEPGDDIHAPYHEAHLVATKCEYLIAKALGVDWIKYDEAVMRL